MPYWENSQVGAVWVRRRLRGYWELIERAFIGFWGNRHIKLLVFLAFLTPVSCPTDGRLLDNNETCETCLAKYEHLVSVSSRIRYDKQIECGIFYPSDLCSFLLKFNVNLVGVDSKLSD
jgi:hypothetical protein